MNDKKKVGRPLKVKSPEEFERLTDEYIALKAEKGEPATVTGWVLHLGLADVCSLNDYEHRSAFSHAGKKSYAKIIEPVEAKVMNGGNQVGAGPIFWLKNVAKWSDKTEIEQKTKLDAKVANVQDENMKAILEQLRYNKEDNE